jgi:hypothetical protein
MCASEIRADLAFDFSSGVENLPVFATLVLLGSFVLGPSRSVDVLAAVVFEFRVGQSLLHLLFVQTAFLGRTQPNASGR